MTTDLALSQPAPMTSSALAFEPNDVQSAINLANILIKSKLLPRSISTPEAAFTVIMTGRELGLTAMQSLRSIHIIEGKPTMSADLMVALCKRSPLCRYFRLVESTGEVATYETQRANEDKPTRLSWTIAQARAAGMAGKGNWKNFPDAMLRARCASSLARAVYPDLMLGVYETDELAPAASIPEIVVSVQSSGEDEAGAFCDRIEAANTLADLETIAPEIKSAGLSQSTLAFVRGAYSARRTQLTAPPIVVTDAEVAA